MRDSYEIHLLEIRQGIKEAETQLRNLVCVDLFRFRKLIELKTLIQTELVAYRRGSERKREFVQFLEG
jgi:hypothetical protein